MRKALLIGIILAAFITGCYSVHNGSRFVESPSKELANKALNPSPGWSVAQSAIQQNPGAGIHLNTPEGSMDYYPPNGGSGNAATNQPPHAPPPGTQLHGAFENRRSNPVDVVVWNSANNQVAAFPVPAHGCYDFWLPMGTYRFNASDKITGESFSAMGDLTGLHKYQTQCAGMADFRMFAE